MTSPAAPRHIAFFTYAGADPMQTGLMQVAQEALAGQGWREGETARISRHFGNRDKALTDRLARQILDEGPAVVLSFMTNATQALQKAAPGGGVEVVAWSMDLHATSLRGRDPRPSITGMSLPGDFQHDQLAVLAALKPGLVRVGHLHHSGYVLAEPALERLRTAAAALPLDLRPFRCETPEAIPQVIAQMQAQGVEALTVGPHEMFNAQGATISQAALAQGLPAVGLESLALHAGVAGYAPDFPAIWRRGGALAARILAGERADAIPVDATIPPLFILNLRAIRALGLRAPETLVRRAHRLIDD